MSDRIMKEVQRLREHSEPSTTAKLALDAAALITSTVPWIGGPVSQVLSGISTARKFERVQEVLDGLAEDLAHVRSQASEEYVRTEDFEELLEKTLRRVGEERGEEKRRIYRAFLRSEIESPGQSFDEQEKLLRAFEPLTPDHVRVLKALTIAPSNRGGLMGSPIQTVRARVPELGEDRIKEVVAELNSQRLTDLQSLMVMMTAHGAEDLRHAIAPQGRRILKYILAEQP